MSLNSNRNRSSSTIKRYFPIFSLAILTIVLLAYFGTEQFSNNGNTDNNFFLNDLYSRTLKPIFTNDQLTKEDVLNFALYNNLPIDKKKNKIIEIKEDLSENEIIEIREASIKENTDNYSRFVEKMELDVDQNKELDELLEDYRQNITNTVFTDDHNTLAVDSRIGLLHRVLRTEIFDFVSRVKARENADLKYPDATLQKFHRIIEEEKSKSVRNYIFFTPDTVLQSEAFFVSEELQHPAEKGQSLTSPVIKVIQKKELKNNHVVEKEKDFTFKIDSNFVQVILSDNFLEDLEIDDYSEFKSILDSKSDKFKLSIGIPDENNLKFSISASIPDSNKEVHYEFNLNDLGEIISSSMEDPLNSKFEDWVEFGIKMDSLVLKQHELKCDTIIHIEHKIP